MINKSIYFNSLFYFSLFVITYSILKYFHIEQENIEKIIYFLVPIFLFIPFNKFNNKFISALIILISFSFIFYFNYLNMIYLLIIFIFLYFFNYTNLYFKFKKLRNIEILFFSIFILFASKIIFWKQVYEIYNLKSEYYLSKIFIYSSLFSNFIDIVYSLLFISVFILLLIFFLKQDNNNVYKNKIFLTLPFFLIFLLASFNTDSFFLNSGSNPLHHWQTYIGPVELMLQGGYLLWDTPSQYGFLSTILIYLMPFDDPWMKFYYLNALLTFIFSLMMFLTIWNRGSLVWLFISFLITYSVIFLLPGGQWQYNVASTPSSGMMRFFVSILLLYIIFISQKYYWINQLLLIVPIWLIGTLWSFESAFYCSCIVLPWVIKNLISTENSNNQKFISLLIFPGTFIITVGLISIYYVITIGNLPDYYAFAEYAFSWLTKPNEMINSSPQTFRADGSILNILLFFSILIFIFKNTKSYNFIILSIIIYLWAVMSLILGKGNDFHINSIISFFIFSFFILISVNSNEYILNSKIIFPILIFIILSSYFNPSIFGNTFGVIKGQDYNLSKVTYDNDKNIDKLLSKIKIKNESFIAISSRYWNYYKKEYYFDNLLDKDQKINNNKWIPVYPGTLFMPISADRTKIYINRWIKRKNIESGWVIFEKQNIWHDSIIKKIKYSLNDYNITKEIKYKNLIGSYYEKK